MTHPSETVESGLVRLDATSRGVTDASDCVQLPSQLSGDSGGHKEEKRIKQNDDEEEENKSPLCWPICFALARGAACQEARGSSDARRLRWKVWRTDAALSSALLHGNRRAQHLLTSVQYSDVSLILETFLCNHIASPLMLL